MAEPTTYEGGCHCGQVRYEAKADLGHVITCNCSICQKHGLMLAFIPTDQFKLVSGEEALSDYQFNKMKVHHLFCRRCGVEVPEPKALFTGPDNLAHPPGDGTVHRLAQDT